MVRDNFGTPFLRLFFLMAAKLRSVSLRAQPFWRLIMLGGFPGIRTQANEIDIIPGSQTFTQLLSVFSFSALRVCPRN